MRKNCFCFNAILVVELKETEPIRNCLEKGTIEVYKPCVTSSAVRRRGAHRARNSNGGGIVGGLNGGGVGVFIVVVGRGSYVDGAGHYDGGVDDRNEYKNEDADNEEMDYVEFMSSYSEEEIL